MPLLGLDLPGVCGHKHFWGSKGLTISGASNSSSEKQAAVSLLFAKGGRPTAHALHALASAGGEFAVSFDPGAGGESPPQGPQWVELLTNGLAFDLTGLAPGPPADRPPHSRSISVDDEAVHGTQAVTLRPGPHLAGGVGMTPVVRSLASLAASLCSLPGVRAVAWHAARSWSAPETYRQGIRRWIEGGVFPGLTLASLSLSADGGMHSEGLALFSGQELRLEPDLTVDRAEAAKLAVRLLDLMIERGRLDSPERLAGPDGAPLRLEPSGNGLFVRVQRG